MIPLRKILSEIQDGSLPNVLYHATASDNVSAIMDRGMDPKKSESASEGIYLSDDEYTAANYANMRPERDHVMLKIDTSYLDPDEFGPDDYELRDFLEMNDWEYNGVEYDSVYDVPWWKSLEMVNQIVYYDIIPSESITPVKSKFLN